MSTQAKPSRWITLAVSLVLVTTAGAAIVGVMPNLGTPSSEATRYGAPRELALPSLGDNKPSTLPAEEFPPLPADALNAYSVDSHFARFDNIIVDVQPDGSLRVLGEQMRMDTFRDLLGRQRGDALPTLVTICPDDDCVFRYVGPVIAVCEEVGIRHKTQPKPDAIPGRPGGPA